MTNSKVMFCFTGSCGEEVDACGGNLYVDFNLTEQHLRVGARIKVVSAVLEVSDVMNDACGKSAQCFGAAAFKFIRAPGNVDQRLRGLFCSIVESDEVNIGDCVELLN